MSSYLFWGLICGLLCILFNILLGASAKQPPVLSHAIELLVAAVGAGGGVKICHYVFDGQLLAAFRASSTRISDDDVIYFLIGGFALIWLSFETIARRLWSTYRQTQT